MKPVSLRELMMHLGAVKVVDPVVDVAFMKAEERRFVEQHDDDPHGRPWHVSHHASSFPGDNRQACGRKALYGLMDVPTGGAFDRWFATIIDAGKALELTQVRRVRDAGYLVTSVDPARSTDPDAVDDQGRPKPQVGFVDAEHWLTGSIDMPILPFGYDRPHVVEIKSKHELKIELMQQGEKSFDPKHRNQLLCALGLANENPGMLGHPETAEPMPAPDDGSIFYLPRDVDWPGPVPTHEFYFEHDPAFMEEGRAHLKDWNRSFVEGELPQTVQRKNSRSHPFGWKWSEGICKFCPEKKLCRADYDAGVVNLQKSNVEAVGMFTRPGYDAAAKRATVLSYWGQDDPLARS